MYKHICMFTFYMYKHKHICINIQGGTEEAK